MNYESAIVTGPNSLAIPAAIRYNAHNILSILATEGLPMTELMWEGKYVNGKKTAPVRLALPFQDVETVNESAQTRNLMLDLWGRNQPGEWRNRLIWGDKRYVLPSLLREFAGKVNLIYIDPPFATGADFSFTATIPDDLDT